MARRRPLVSRGPRRKRFWNDTLFTDTTADGTQDDVDLLNTPSQFQKYGLTLVRTIVSIIVRPTVLVGATGLQAVDYGIALVGQDALAASALPDLNFADDSPVKGWIWRTRVYVEDHTTAGLMNQPAPGPAGFRSKMSSTLRSSWTSLPILYLSHPKPAA